MDDVLPGGAGLCGTGQDWIGLDRMQSPNDWSDSKSTALNGINSSFEREDANATAKY